MDEQIAGHRGVPRWWPGDMVRLVDDTTRLRNAIDWTPIAGDATSRFPAVMTDDQVTEAVNHHYVSSPRDRWKTLAEERASAIQAVLDLCDDPPMVDIGGSRLLAGRVLDDIRALLTPEVLSVVTGRNNP